MGEIVSTRGRVGRGLGAQGHSAKAASFVPRRGEQSMSLCVHVPSWLSVSACALAVARGFLNGGGGGSRSRPVLEPGTSGFRASKARRPALSFAFEDEGKPTENLHPEPGRRAL